MNPDPYDEDDDLAAQLDREEQRGMLLGIGAVILMAALTVAAAWLVCGCGSVFYGANGKPSAVIHGDYEWHKNADGSESVSVRHSETIRAQGNAVSKSIGAAGTAASAALIIK